MGRNREEEALAHIDEERLLATATALVEVPSPTLEAGAVAHRLEIGRAHV